MEFTYIAIDQQGRKQKGVVSAKTESEVAAFLRTNHLTTINVKKKEKVRIPFFKKIKKSDVVLFTRQLSSMILTGLTLLESFNILRQQMSNQEMKTVIDDIIDSISEGSSFSAALARHKDVFSDVYIALIRAAESGGILDKVLPRLAENLEKSDDLQKKVKSALFYPAIVITGVAIVILVMNIFVIPKLGELYKSLNLSLPLTTRIVLGLSTLTSQLYPFVLLAAVGGYIGYRRFKKTETGIKTLDRVKLRFPVLGPIVTLSILAELTRTLSLLISSGTSILEALGITANVAGNVWYRDAILRASAMVEKGVPLSTALGAQKIFPPITVQMVKVGESTGKIDESLLKNSEYFERDVDLRVKTLTSSIEPLLILVLGVVVGFLILSVITPIYSLISQIQ